MIKRFWRNTDGNFAIFFALSLLGIVACVGAALDYTALAKKESQFQSIADAAILAAVRSGETDEDALLQIARNSLLGNDQAGIINSSQITVLADGTVRIELTGSYNTIIMGMFGKHSYDVAVAAESPLPSSEPIHIALALDVTGSMGYNSKLVTLKTAAKNLVTTLAAYDNDAIKISVVPFAEYVNVGLSRRNEPWLDVNADWVESFPEECSTTTPVTGTENCRMEPYPAQGPTPPTPPGTCYNDGVAYSCGGSSGSSGYPAGESEVCDDILGAPVTTCFSPTSSHTWSGCVGSRENGWDQKVEYTVGKKIPGLLDERRCNEEVLTLTNDLNAVKTRIDSLSAINATYVPAGLLWGWRTLDSRMPFTEANTAYVANTKSVMILMTDGV